MHPPGLLKDTSIWRLFAECIRVPCPFFLLLSCLLQVVAPSLLAAYGPGEGAGGAALVDSLLQTAWAYLTR